MSTPDIAGLFEFARIKRTELVGAAKDRVVAYLHGTEPVDQDPATPDPNAIESEPAEILSSYGFASRAPQNAESFTVRVGSMFAVLASRVAGALAGQMGEGDSVLYTIGGNMIWLSAKGAISAIVKTTNGKQFVARVDPKGAGSLKVMNGAGHTIEFSEENGLAVNIGDLPFSIRCGKFQNIGQTALFYVGAFKPTASASVPFTGGSAMPPCSGFFIGG